MAAVLLTYTPLRLFSPGRSPVIIFFTLSGFVLTVMLTRDPRLSYGGFIAKRVCRIYLPYLFVVSMGLALMGSFRVHGIVGLSAWFNDSWTHSISPGLLLDHVFLLGNSAYNYVDNPIWTLVHEMRYSLVFPVIVWIALRTRPRYTLAGSFALSLTGVAGLRLLPGNQGFDSLQFLVIFVAGAELALHREAVQDWYRQRSARLRALLFSVALLLLVANDLPRRHAVLEVLAFNVIGTDLGAALLLLCLIGAKSSRAVLERRPLLWLGRISYSLYLSHLLVLLTVLYGLQKIAAPQVLIWFVPPAAIAVAALLYRTVERPAKALGENLRGYFMREVFVRQVILPR